jgi:hypothetical protein
LRIEFEDHSGSTTVFAERNTELSTRDFVYALIGDRTLHSFCDAYEYDGTELHDLIMLMKQEDNHEFGWLKEHGLGHVEDEKTIMRIFHMRKFITSTEKEMANLYCWDGQSIFKVVVFPNTLKKVKHLLKVNEWFAARLEKIEDKKSLTRLDSYKVESDSGLISLQDYIQRKGIKVPESV